MRKIIGNNLPTSFDDMKFLFNESIKNKDKYTIYLELVDILRKNGRTGLTRVMTCSTNKDNLHIANTKNSSIMTLHGVEKIIKLSGQILVPINDDDIDTINKFTGNCTILDGGIVTINSLLYDYDIDESFIDSFTPVSDISTELIEYK